MQAIQYENFDLGLDIQAKDHEIEICQNQIVDLIENRHVPRSGNIDNILCVVEKNTPDEIPIT